MARETALVVSPGGPIARAALWLARSVGALVSSPTEHSPGRDYHVPYGVDPSYEPQQSMSAFAAFPWVRACIVAIGEDLSGLPVVVKRGRGAKAVRVEDHPVLALLDNPNSQTDAQLYRMQLVVDLELTGTKYELVLSASRNRLDPAAIERLHPQRTKPATNQGGRVVEYIYEGGGEIVRYAADRVLMGRLPSWEDGPESLLGTGAIQTLHEDLTAELAARKRAAEAAKTGRPDAIAYPDRDKDGAGAWTTSQVKEASDSLNAAFKARHGGVAFMRNGIQLEVLGWSPRDMEFGEQRQFTRESVLAVFGVPPTRLQLPTANYAQSESQLRQYWQSLQAKAKRYTDAWTKLARMMPGASPEDRVELDFSGVAHLQEDRTARLGRVTTHILNGMSPTKAYAYEGFEDAPIEDAAFGVDPDAAIEPDAGTAVPAGGGAVADLALNGAQISSLLEVLAQVSAGLLTPEGAIALLQVAFPTIDEGEARRIVSGAQEAPPPPAVEPSDAEVQRAAKGWSEAIEAMQYAKRLGRPITREQRDAVWKGWAEVQEQVEAQIQIRVRRYLAGASKRIAAKVAAALENQKAIGGVIQKDLTAAEMLRILAGESALLRGALGDVLRRAVERAFAATAQQLGEYMDFDPPKSDAEKFIGDLITRVSDTTKSIVGEVVRRGLDEGLSVADIAAKVAESPAFTPTRAMGIARTESTRALNAGSSDAMKAARDAGVNVRKEWLSARDPFVRAAHVALDGQVVPAGGKFTVPASSSEFAGASGAYPGDFAEAGMCVNCRCTVLPVVD